MKIRIAAKCSDLFFMENLETGQEYHGYVPSFLGKNADFVGLVIDTQTGQIENWTGTPDIIQDFFDETDEGDY